MTRRQIYLRIAATLVWLAAMALAGLMALMSPMMFDAPTAIDDHRIWAIFTAVLLTPLTCLFAAIIPWILRSRTGWILMIAVPFAHLCIIVALGLMLS
jgi:hypothetical protein